MITLHTYPPPLKKVMSSFIDIPYIQYNKHTLSQTPSLPLFLCDQVYEHFNAQSANLVSFVTAAQAHPHSDHRIAQMRSAKVARAAGRKLLSTTSSSGENATVTGVIYITSNILTGLLIMIPLVFLLIGTVVASMAIEAPPRMSRYALAPSKEY